MAAVVRMSIAFFDDPRAVVPTASASWVWAFVNPNFSIDLSAVLICGDRSFMFPPVFLIAVAILAWASSSSFPALTENAATPTAAAPTARRPTPAALPSAEK